MNQITDMHCHILPGIDDGADSLELAVQFCKGIIKDGRTGLLF